MRLDRVSIEVTRNCNMCCDHCLRGDSENFNISETYIDSLMQQIDEIGELTISGGEPTLAVSKIKYILKAAKKHKVEIQNFYIATNGKHIPNDFINILLDFWLYCTDNEISKVEYSNDIFHEEISEENEKKLKALSFYSRRYKNEYDYAMNTKRSSIIQQGRGENFYGRENKAFDYNYRDTIHYLNCKGQIINGCDWSYDDQTDHVLCKVQNLKEFILQTESYKEEQEEV